MFAAVGDIKQEPGSPPSAGEEGGWGEVGATGGGGKGDCLYDIVSSQTRFKHQQDNRNQVRYAETGDRTRLVDKIYFFYLTERGLRARSAQDK